ncbi:MAG: patatin-like phospholipase family protein [Bacilli bacterium]|nr:patatin-like phospholipase family protein [Bacilli bacterium]
MKAVVLSGGGSKGAYQVGVWKALRKLKIDYDIVTGTSVGALNGAFMVQNEYRKAFHLWKKISMKVLFGDHINIPKSAKETLKIYGNNFLKNRGMDVSKLQDLIMQYINYDKFYQSGINFGLVTINISSKKVIQLKKNKIPKDKLGDYLMASSSCYPAFQLKEIDGSKFIDGGMFDNLPINLAIELGADEIIAVDLSAPGIKQRPKKKVKITKIKPNNKLTNFLNFNEQGSRRNIKFGYNDTLKVYHKLFGKKFTFKNRGFQKTSEEYKDIFFHNLNIILKHKEISKILKIEKLNFHNLLLKTCEQIGQDFGFDETKIYSFRKFNKKILKRANQLRKENLKINKTILLYDKLLHKNFRYIKTKGLLSPRELIKALYLYTLCEV